MIIDKKSTKILKILQDKARIPNTEVARQVGLAPSAALERIRKLESQGVIEGYEVRLNPEMFSRNQVAFVHIQVNPADDISGSVGEQLSTIEEIQEVHFIAGEDCYLVKLRVADTKELGEVLKSKISKIKGIVSTKTSTVLLTHKETAKIPIRI